MSIREMTQVQGDLGGEETKGHSGRVKAAVHHYCVCRLNI